MRRCEDCRIILDRDARFCPKCGKELSEDNKVEDVSRQIAALLALANLHRSRREWNAAIAEATRALELDSSSPEAAYLLGLIHEQRGDIEEAEMWYRAALDLDPDDPVIRSKLDRITKSSGVSAVRLLGKRQIILLGAAVLFLVVLTALITSWAVRPNQLRTEHKIKTGSASRKTQIRTPVTQTTTQSALPTNTGATPTTPFTTQPAASLSSRTAGESALKARLAEISTLRGTGAVVDDVIADPRSGTVIITFSLLYSPTSGLTKTKVLEYAWHIARAACAANTEVRNVIVRCIITPAGPETTQIAFIGEVKRSTLENLGESPTLAQLDGSFENKWWNPQIS